MLVILRLILSVHYATSVTVHQSPDALTGSPGQNVQVKCIVEDGTGSESMNWYSQSPGEGPRSMFYSAGAKIVQPKTAVAGFTAERPNSNEFYLKSAGLEANSSAMYFCAWSVETAFDSEAYFGIGTKLVVVDTSLTLQSPQVTILQPSAQEIKSKGKATVICLITDFYPDNIKIHWLLDNIEQPKDSPNIQTDPISQRNEGGKTFSISSRFTLAAHVYAKAKDIICQVDHYQDAVRAQTVNGTHNIKHETCGLNKEAKIQTMEAAKLTYLILICKSILYGIIVSVLACKTKASYNKRFD